MAISNGSLNWQLGAKCAEPENLPMMEAFFSSDPEDKSTAKNLCFSCDVRKDCVIWALESGTIWGIWGGRDENELRRTLSVSAEGNEVRRGRYPQCPYCSARTSKLRVNIIDLPDGGRWTTAKTVECLTCGTEWRSRSSANAVTAYHTERAVEAAKIARKNMEEAEKIWEEASLSARLAVEVETQAREIMETAFSDTTYTPEAEQEKVISKEVHKQAKKEARIKTGAASRAQIRYHELSKILTEANIRAKSTPSGPK